MINRKTKKVNLEKQYIFPKRLTTIKYRDKILIISNETANWIVLENEKQLLFFNLLTEHKLGDALKLFDGDIQDARAVVIQIEAKNLENVLVKRSRRGRLQLFLTNACNLRCPHCYMYAGSKNENELSTDEICHLLDEFKKNDGDTVVLTGGEICTRSDLYLIVKHAYELGISVQLLSNGTLWTENDIDKISQFISQIQISIDGFSEIENAKIRGEHNFEKALSCVDRFIKNGIHTEIAVTPLYDSDLKSKISSYANFGKYLLDKYSGKNFRVIFSGEMLDGRNVHLTEEQEQEYKDIIGKIYTECYDSASEASFIEAMKEHEIMDNCSFGNLAISSTGDVYMCGRLTYLKSVANIREDGYERIFQIAQKASTYSNINNLSPCKDCELKYICGGECRIKHFPQLAEADFDSLTPEQILPRECDIQKKSYFYDLMIKTNTSIFE